ncbi:uncharacterized protein LOC135350312 isoform X2 [Halichondria panicea]|uniref:uncharacterized protein LOC135350312 isoform X2 n=1 Tax=Halichondria panicea TaxID=6063 RepID=UPI00312B514E
MSVKKGSGGGGSIVVHNSELYSELMRDCTQQQNEEVVDQKQSSVVSPLVSPRQHYGSSPTRVPSRSSTAQMTRIEDWLSRKARRAVVSFPDDPKLTALKQHCDIIYKEEEDFLADMDLYLALQEERQQCKKEILYKKWCERVFIPVQAQIEAQLSSDDFQALVSEKRELFDQYLIYRNEKQVFLDTIIPDEYNPLPTGALQYIPQVHTGVLDDPLIAQRTDYNKEKMILSGCGQELPLQHFRPPCDGRGNTDPVRWLKMQLVHIDSEVRQKSKNRMCCDHNSESRKQVGSERELDIPHKRTVHYPRKQFQLTWRNDHITNSDADSA